VARISSCRSIVSAIILSLISLGASAAGGIAYTQLTSLQSQPATNPANLVYLENIDGIQNIGTAPTKVIINVTGFYFITAVGQAGPVKGGTTGDGYVDMWLVKNNVSLANTNTRQSVSATISGTIVTQSILQLNAGDSISIGFAASNPAYGLIAIPATRNEPAVTSATLTLYKL